MRIESPTNKGYNLGLDWTVSVAPSTYPITLEEAKNYLRVDYSGDDTLINTIIKVATEHAEKYCNRSISQKTVVFSYRNFMQRLILPYPPYRSITEVKTKFEGEETVLTVNTDFYIEGISDKLINFKKYYENTEVIITADVGYSVVPETLKGAILKIIAKLYEYRQDYIEASVSQLKDSIKLLNDYKIFII